MRHGLFASLYKFSFFVVSVFAAVAFFFLFGCRSQMPKSERMNEFPPVILWAWERPEDLDFLDPQKYGIAYLAQTLELNGDAVVIRPRRQPLQVPPEAKIIA